MTAEPPVLIFALSWVFHLTCIPLTYFASLWVAYRLSLLASVDIDNQQSFVPALVDIPNKSAENNTSYIPLAARIIYPSACNAILVWSPDVVACAQKEVSAKSRHLNYPPVAPLNEGSCASNLHSPNSKRSSAFNLVWSASVNTFESVAASTAALTSALLN